MLSIEQSWLVWAPLPVVLITSIPVYACVSYSLYCSTVTISTHRIYCCIPVIIMNPWLRFHNQLMQPVQAAKNTLATTTWLLKETLF